MKLVLLKLMSNKTDKLTLYENVFRYFETNDSKFNSNYARY